MKIFVLFCLDSAESRGTWAAAHTKGARHEDFRVRVPDRTAPVVTGDEGT